ncbi:MAG TPA: hypothetical protein ENJ20_05790 [Bacteroidetes bacterium]|nr:hypothetical protein [Bacteroidota bacterium]
MMKNMKPLLLLLSLALCGTVFSQNVEIRNLSEVNSEELDFSPMPFGNGIMFTSSKSDRFFTCPVYDSQDSYVDLYYAEKNPDGTWKEPVVLKGKVNGKYHDGVPAFLPSGDRMVFTRNNLNGKNAQNVIDLKLYTGDFQNQTWVNATNPLPFNSDDWSTAHPALSSDGSLLIFSSNRPGSTLGIDGKPSMDLWGSRLENGVWSIPFNLGPSVNTGKNELFPVLNENGALFFSSNGHPGEGGLDIFAALPGNGDEWELVGNIGTPFNTSSDDMSFVALNNGTEGYLASDRGASDAKGRDDIYEWSRTSGFQDAIIQVVDKQTGAPLPNADISIDPGQLRNESMMKYGPTLEKIFGGGDPEMMVVKPLKLKTDEEGKVKLRILSPATFAIVASKTEYKQESRNPTDADLTAEPVYVIPLEKEKYFAKLIVKVVEDPSGNPISLPDITIVNKRTGKVVFSEKGDNNGQATTQIDCDDDYEVKAGRDPYYDNSVTLSDYMVDCRNGEVTVVVPLKSPRIVLLEPVFFDFDRYYIRSRDAKPTLDSLATIMKMYPTLYIQLDGNTDSRGTNQYNLNLSRNRAKSAMKYLIRKGVEAERLSTEWFGETKLANNCSDNVVCPEEDHQINRRVDVVAVRHQEPGVKFVTRPLSEIHVVSDRK